MIFKSNVDVKITDGALVVSCLAAGEEKVWRAQLSLLPVIAIELRQQRDRTAMILKYEGGREEEIASFEEHRKAEAALRKVAQALLTPVVPSRGGWFKKLFVFLILFFALVLLWAKTVGGPDPSGISRSSMKRNLPQSTAPAQLAPAPSVPTGVPVPAEELLKE